MILFCKVYANCEKDFFSNFVSLYKYLASCLLYVPIAYGSRMNQMSIFATINVFLPHGLNAFLKMLADLCSKNICGFVVHFINLKYKPIY
jgi:hypothetical protein